MQRFLNVYEYEIYKRYVHRPRRTSDTDSDQHLHMPHRDREGSENLPHHRDHSELVTASWIACLGQQLTFDSMTARSKVGTDGSKAADIAIHQTTLTPRLVTFGTHTSPLSHQPTILTARSMSSSTQHFTVPKPNVLLLNEYILIQPTSVSISNETTAPGVLEIR